MTDKRFTIKEIDNFSYGIKVTDVILDNDGIELPQSTVCDLLNNLHEENQSSKEFIEQLQEELVLFKKAGADMGNDLNAQITALKEENEQLKQRIKNRLHFYRELYETTNDDVVKRVIEDLEDILR